MALVGIQKNEQPCSKKLKEQLKEINRGLDSDFERTKKIMNVPETKLISPEFLLPKLKYFDRPDDEWHSLVKASSAGDIARVKSLLKKQIDVNVRMEDGTSAFIMLASLRGYPKVAKLLIEQGANVNIQSKEQQFSALMLASANGHYEVVKLLLENGAQPDMRNCKDVTSLMLASIRGHYEVADLLLKNCAQVELKDQTGTSALQFASQEGFHKIVKLLLKFGALIDVQDSNGYSALIIAIFQNHYKVVELLLNEGAQVSLRDNLGQSALHIAASEGHTKIVELLLLKDVEVNIVNSDGISPLMLACTTGRYATAKLLIKKDAKVNAQENIGITALMKACAVKSCHKIVKLLLESGAHPNMQDTFGVSALSGATYYEAAELLLDYGAHPNLQDYNGCSPLEYFALTGQRDMIELLLDRGAQSNYLDADGYSILAHIAKKGDYRIIQAFQKRAQVDKTDLWLALKVAIDTCSTSGSDYDQRVIELLYEMCLDVIRRNQVLVADSRFPGIVFHSFPIQESVTSEGATILSEDTGISLSIPEHSLSHGEDKVDILIHPCFSGPFELPPGYESASPAYLIQSSRRVNLQRDVTLKIHHYTNLVSEEDCEEMVFLSASTTPQLRQFGPVYAFKELKHNKGIFTPNSQVGQIRASHFCFVKIARWIRRQSSVEGIYSVRLYRSGLSQSTGVTAVFCMCLYHPLYIKHCDERIMQKYSALSCEGEASSVSLVKMKTDEVTLSVSQSQGWTVTFDREPTKILKREVDLPILFNNVNISELTDYPPKFSIFAHRLQACSDVESSRPQLQVQGLDVEDCSFEILTPCSTRSSTSPSLTPLTPSPAPPTAAASLASHPVLQPLTQQQSSEVTIADSMPTSTSPSPGSPPSPLLSPSTPSTPSQSTESSQITESVEQNKTQSKTSLTPLNILTELETINQELSSLALFLRVEMGNIETDYPNSVQKRKEEMIKKWIQTGGDSSSWETLCEALRSKLVCRPDVADTIQKKYCQTSLEAL